MNSLKAALVLTLEDKLSAGIGRLKAEMDQLRQLGSRLSLGKLGEGVQTLRQLDQGVGRLTRNLRTMGAVASRAWSRVKQATAGPIGRVRQAFSQEGKVGALGAAVQGYSVIAPIRTYAGFQDLALRAAITQGLSGAAAQREAGSLMQFFRRDARETGQSSASVGAAYLDLIQQGMAPALAKALLPIHSKAATAYGIDPEALGHAVFALADTMKIGEKDMGGALAAMALAAQKGRFKIDDFSRYLPGITGNAAKLGMTGRGNANFLFAALETVMRNSSDAGTGATNFTDLMNYLTSQHAMRSFSLQSRGMSDEQKRVMAKYHLTGIDIDAVLQDAKARGLSPVEGVLGALQVKLAHLDPIARSEALGAYFGNQQARDAAVALLLHPKEFLQLRQQLAGAQGSKLNTDFNTRMSGAAVKTKQFGEALSELGQTLGRGFLPILLGVNWALGGLLDGLDWLNARAPGVENVVLLVVGAVLALGSALGIWGLAWPAISAGWALFRVALELALKPLKLVWTALSFVVDALAAIIGVSAGAVVAILAIAAVLAAAAIDIYDHWSAFRDFFYGMWEGIKDIFAGFAEFLFGVFTGDMGTAWAGLKRIWSGVGAFFGGLWGVVRQLFVDFGTWVDGWTNGAMTAAVNGIKNAWSGLKTWFATLWRDIRKPFEDFANHVANSAVGKLFHLSDTPQLQAPSGQKAPAAPTNGPDLSGGSYLMPVAPRANVKVGVGVDPNNGQIRVTHVHSDTPAVHAAGMPDAGRVLGKP